jgi:hypothetical protein
MDGREEDRMDEDKKGLSGKVEGESALTRRNFLKAASIGALTVASASMFACSPTTKSTDTTTDDSTDTTEDAAAAAKAEGRVYGYCGPGDWLGDAPVFSESQISETRTCDVCVIGCGHSGTQASLAAATAGAQVINVDLQGTLSWYGEDMGNFNSKFITDQGFGTWNLGAIVDEFVTRGGGRNYPDIVRLYVENSGATLDNMISTAKEMGVDSRAYTYDNTKDGWVIVQANMDYDKYQSTGDAYASLNKTDYPLHPGTKTWVGAVQFMGVYNDEPIQGVAANSVLPLIEQACIDKAKKLGAQFYLSSEAQVLLQNADGTVTGIITKEDDNYVKITAKAVILAGGDYAANSDMCWALLNEVMERNEREGGVKSKFYSFMGGRNGSSVKMGCWAGGRIDPSGARGHMSLGGGIGGPWGSNAMLQLNAQGKRFANEGNITGFQTAAWRQPSGTGYLVTDKKWLKSVCTSGIEHGGPNCGRPQFYQDMIDDMAAIQVGASGGQVENCTIAERGYTTVIAANTLKELAGYMGVEDVDTFLASIAEYNTMCYAGADSAYGKDASAMIPVDEAPFYGITGTVGSRSASPSMVTMSGLETNTKLQVLNESYEPIGGLYACGNSLGGRYGTGYATPTAGNSIGMACTHGRLAGQFAAANL